MRATEIVQRPHAGGDGPPKHVGQRPVAPHASLRRKAPEVAMDDISERQVLAVHVGVGEQRFLLVENEVRGQAAREEQGRERERRHHRHPEVRVLGQKNADARRFSDSTKPSVGSLPNSFGLRPLPKRPSAR